jgi:hypothetical protein
MNAPRYSLGFALILHSPDACGDLGGGPMLAAARAQPGACVVLSLGNEGAVTGVFSYSGRFIAEALLAR